MSNFNNIYMKLINEKINIKDYQPGKPVKSTNLKPGKLYFTYYVNGGMERVQLFEFTGFSNMDQKYGDSGPIFKTLKDVKNEYGVKNMKQIEALGNDKEYGYGIYMCGKFSDGLEGCFFYPYNGRWVRGSGADALSFSEAIKITPED